MINITLAKYSKKSNAVRERRICSVATWEQALNYLDAHYGKPLQVWADNAATLDYMPFGCIDTKAYSQEYAKILD